MNRVIKEPLFSFLVLSVLFFAVFQFRAPEPAPLIDEITVSEADIKILGRDFEKKWLRSPTEDEMDGLIQSFIREEILYREALLLGLDQNDSEIRRRLSQKMIFLSEDISPLRKPTEQELQAFLNDNQTAYRHAPRFSFRHIYFNSHNDDADNGEITAEQKAISLLLSLKHKNAPEEPVGDPLMIASEFTDETAAEIKRLLGSDFLASLQNLSSDGWHGPVKSSFGIHLVRLDSKREAKNATIDEVRDLVIRDWTMLQQKQQNMAFYEQLREKYSVVIAKQQLSSTNVGLEGNSLLATSDVQQP